jgi:hypothetical protein
MRLYEGEALPTNEVATLRIGEGVKTLKSGSGKLVSGNVGELLPGRHEITIEGWWWDRTKATHIIRIAAGIPCLTLAFTPLGIACLPLFKPDKTCDCHASIDVSAGKEYEVYVDWSGESPMLRVSESTGNITVVTAECVIRE